MVSKAQRSVSSARGDSNCFSLPFRATDHQETCARILLYEANKDVKNNSGQTPSGLLGQVGGGVKNSEG